MRAIKVSKKFYTSCRFNTQTLRVRHRLLVLFLYRNSGEMAKVLLAFFLLLLFLSGTNIGLINLALQIKNLEFPVGEQDMPCASKIKKMSDLSK